MCVWGGGGEATKVYEFCSLLKEADRRGCVGEGV